MKQIRKRANIKNKNELNEHQILMNEFISESDDKQNSMKRNYSSLFSLCHWHEIDILAENFQFFENQFSTNRLMVNEVA